MWITKNIMLQPTSGQRHTSILVLSGNLNFFLNITSHGNITFIPVLEIRIFLNRPNSMKIPKFKFKFDHFNTNLGKIYRPNQDLNWPSSIFTGWGWLLPPNFAHCIQ